MYLIIIDADKNYTVIPEQGLGDLEPRIHHVQPVRVIASSRFKVGAHGLAGNLTVFRNRVFEIILVYEGLPVLYGGSMFTPSLIQCK